MELNKRFNMWSLEHRRLLSGVLFFIKLARGMIDSPYLLSNILQFHIPRIYSRMNNLFYVPINNAQSLDSLIDNICNKFDTILIESDLDTDI